MVVEGVHGGKWIWSEKPGKGEVLLESLQIPIVLLSLTCVSPKTWTQRKLHMNLVVTDLWVDSAFL